MWLHARGMQPHQYMNAPNHGKLVCLVHLLPFERFRMPASLTGRLVVAISSRALFDFEEENHVFEGSDDHAYMQLQLARVDEPARPGVAHALVRKLLAFNTPAASQVEVVILSRNDPVSGMRVFRSAQHDGLPIERGVFTRGRPPWQYLKPLGAHLFLSAITDCP